MFLMDGFSMKKLWYSQIALLPSFSRMFTNLGLEHLVPLAPARGVRREVLERGEIGCAASCGLLDISYVISVPGYG